MAHGKFHGPWKFPWPVEISRGGLISPRTSSAGLFVCDEEQQQQHEEEVSHILGVRIKELVYCCESCLASSLAAGKLERSIGSTLPHHLKQPPATAQHQIPTRRGHGHGIIGIVINHHQHDCHVIVN